MTEDIRFLMKKAPLDVWSVREKLALASSVMRSGDQNWVSVSRAIRPFGNPGRPADWFSQKNCALQYSALLEKVETPRRKRGEREVTETPGDVIVRKLTIERIEELKRLIHDEAAKYRSLKKELELVRSGEVDHQIKELWEKLQSDKAAAREAAANKAAEEQRARELAKAAASRLKKPLLCMKKPAAVGAASDHEDSTQDSMFDVLNNEDSNQSANIGSSRLVEANVSGTASMPASPSLSKLSESQYKLSPEKQLQSAVEVTEADVIESLLEVSVMDIKQEETDVGDSINVADENDINASDLPIGTTPLSDESLQDALDAAIAVMKDDDSIKVEELLELGSPEFRGAFEAVSTSGIQDVEVVVSSAEEIPSVLASPRKAASVAQTPEMSDVNTSVVDMATTDLPVKTDIKVAGVAVETAAASDGDAAVPSVKSVPTPEEVFDEALSPASSILSVEAGSTSVGRPTASAQRSGRGNKLRLGPRRSTQARQSVGRESEKSSKPSDDTSEDEVLSSHTHDENIGDLFNTSIRSKLELSESLPNSPASFSHSDTEDEKAHKIWKKSIMLVWRSVANHKFANVFLHPVTEDIAPGYHSVVHRPMDLSTIKKNIDNGALRTTAEFQRDMMLMFINAMMYNNTEHDVHKMALEMYNDVMVTIEHFVNTQMMVQAEPKLLRTLRRADGHSDKEDETRKRKTSEAEQQPTTPATGAAGGSAAKKRR